MGRKVWVSFTWITFQPLLEEIAKYCCIASSFHNIFIWCTMRCTELRGTQRSPELSLRSTDFCVPENIIFPVLCKICLQLGRKVLKRCEQFGVFGRKTEHYLPVTVIYVTGIIVIARHTYFFVYYRRCFVNNLPQLLIYLTFFSSYSTFSVTPYYLSHTLYLTFTNNGSFINKRI